MRSRKALGQGKYMRSKGAVLLDGAFFSQGSVAGGSCTHVRHRIFIPLCNASMGGVMIVQRPQSVKLVKVVWLAYMV